MFQFLYHNVVDNTTLYMIHILWKLYSSILCVYVCISTYKNFFSKLREILPFKIWSYKWFSNMWMKKYWVTSLDFYTIILLLCAEFSVYMSSLLLRLPWYSCSEMKGRAYWTRNVGYNHKISGEIETFACTYGNIKHHLSGVLWSQNSS